MDSKIRWLRYFVLLTLSISHLCGCQVEAKEQPNVIIVITDDQGYGDMGHTGNPIIKTPTIDMFADQAVSLTNYHVGTTCSPTRAGLLTGRNCNRNGVWHTIMGASILNRDETTIADVLKRNGYETGMFGKWHLGDNHPFLPQDRGFEETFYHGGGGVGQTPDYWNNDYFDDTYFRNGKAEKREGYCTDIWFDEAIKFVEDKKDEPFFCYLSLNAPHSPFNVPKKYYDLYKNESSLKESQKRFYGMITNIDYNFSRLLEKLEALGIAENTIVIFTTDNGTANGYIVDKKTQEVYGYNAGMRGTKGSEYDGGHRVPFMIRWPNGGIGGGKKLPGLTAHVDILPTLVSLANIDYSSSKSMDGMDVSNYLLGKEESQKRCLVTDTQRKLWPVKGKQSCVMRAGWRLVNGNELYLIDEDSVQQNNIADRHPGIVQEMQEFYEKWWANVIKETKYSIIDLGVNLQDVITCHDAHTGDEFPPWNQQKIRQGKPMKPAKFLVNFVKDGKYKFRLMRWPEESGLALGDETLDDLPATLYADGRIKGTAMSFKKAYLKIGEQEYTADVNNFDNSVTIKVQVEKGKTELLAYFDMEDGNQTNAFYIYVERIN